LALKVVSSRIQPSVLKIQYLQRCSHAFWMPDQVLHENQKDIYGQILVVGSIHSPPGIAQERLECISFQKIDHIVLHKRPTLYFPY